MHHSSSSNSSTVYDGQFRTSILFRFRYNVSLRLIPANMEACPYGERIFLKDTFIWNSDSEWWWNATRKPEDHVPLWRSSRFLRNYLYCSIQRLEVALIHKSVEQASEREIIRIFRINYGLSSDILLPNTPHLIFSFEHSLIFRSNSLFSDILVLW